jgi:hypothetical protein
MNEGASVLMNLRPATSYFVAISIQAESRIK